MIMYYLLKLVKLGVYGLAGLLILISVYGLFRLGTVDAIQKKLAKRQFGHPAVWVQLTALILAANLFFAYMMADTYGIGDIVLNYNKASQGLNPNGTRFNSSEILSDVVLQRAIDRGALEGITVDDLRNCLTMKPTVQGGTSSQKSYFISTQFRLTYNKSKETWQLQPATVLQLVGESYREWFIDQYAENADILTQDPIDFADEDYLDICEYLNAQAEKVQRYMNRLDKRESSFTSSKTSETFTSISNRAYNIHKVMVERLRAYVMENSITKNRDAYLGRLGIENVFLYFDELTQAAYNRNALTAVSMYEDDMARIVLVPTYDKSSQFYMSETRIGVDDYAEEARNYATSKNSLRSDISVNNHSIEQFRRGETSVMDEKAELLVQQIGSEMERVCRDAQNLAQEYFDWESNEYVSLALKPFDDKIMDIISQTVKYTLVLVVPMFAAYVIWAEEKKPGKQRKIEEKEEAEV